MERFCVNCAYHKFVLEHECNAPEGLDGVNLVTGRPMRKYAYCSAARIDPRACGEAGKWFKAKETANAPA